MFGAAVTITRLQIRVCPRCDCYTRTFKHYDQQKFLNTKSNFKVFNVSRNFGSWRSTLFNKSWRTNDYGWNRFNTQILNRLNLIKRFFCQEIRTPNPLRVNTNVKNNVMLYRYNSDTLMRGAMIFAILATLGCLFMADNVYMILCKDLFNKTIPLKQRLWEHIFPLSAIVIGILAGPVIVACVCYLTVRTIKYIVLLKGGKNVTIVTYHPMFSYTKTVVPVTDVSCKVSRDEKKGYSLLLVKNKKIKYMVDKSGHFVNPELFDCTVGASRD